MIFKNISLILLLFSTTTLSSQITTDTVSFQEKKKRDIESTSIFELSLSVLPIGWGECYNAQLGCCYDILRDFGGGFGLTLFGIMLNKKHILNLKISYLLTNVQYRSWACVIPIPEKTFHDEFINSTLFKARYELITFSSKNIHINPFTGIGIGVDIPLGLNLNVESGFNAFYKKFGIMSSIMYKPYGRRYRRAFTASFGIVFRIKR